MILNFTGSTVNTTMEMNIALKLPRIECCIFCLEQNVLVGSGCH